MTNIKSVCVYCGSSVGFDPLFQQAAQQLGTLLAKNKLKLIFGGGRVGLMGVISAACVKAGGEVIGVMTSFLKDYEGAQDGLTKLNIVGSMYERKQTLFGLADAFIILPGGLGTLDETFEVMTQKQVGLHAKKIIFVNLKNYWMPLLSSTLDKMIAEGFIREEDRKLFQIVNTIEEAILALHKEPSPEERFTPKWQ